MKTLQKIIFLSVIMLSSLRAYPQLNISVLVNPPYPTHLDDYLNYGAVMVITVTNTGTSSKDYYLRGSIVGDNGVSLVSNPDVIPGEFLTIGAGQTKLLYGNDIAPYFDFNSAIVSGVDQNSLIRNEALPEGNYDVCLEAYEHITNTLLTPVEACGYFFIRYIQPPIITSPICGDTVLYTSPQTMVFSWTPAIGAPAITQYKLKIAEVIPDNRNPYDALHSATTPPFFEQNIMGYSFVYGPGQPPLERGKKYAFSVTAIDPAGNASFINNGESEVCTFIYGEQEQTTSSPSFNDMFDQIPDIYLNGYTITGNMTYFLSTEGEANTHPLSYEPLEIVYGQILVENGTQKTYYFVEPDFDYNIANPAGSNIVATTTTNAAGDFHFNFDQVEPLGLVMSNYTMNAIINGDKITATGNIYRVLLITVPDAHYCFPEYAVMAEDLIYGGITETGTLTSRVRDYTLAYTFNASPEEAPMTYYLGGFMDMGETMFDAGMMAALTATNTDDTPQNNAGDMTAAFQDIANNGIFIDDADMPYAQADPLDMTEIQDINGIPELLTEGEYNIDIYRTFMPAGIPAEEGNIPGNVVVDGMHHIYHGVTISKKINVPGLVKSTSPSDVYILIVTPVSDRFEQAKLQYQFQFTYEADLTLDPPWTQTDMAIFNSAYESPLVPFESTNSSLTGSTTILSGNMRYKFAEPGESATHALKNHTIKLVKQYAIDKGDGNMEYIPYAGSADSDVSGNLGTIATTTTDGYGGFVFSFSNYTRLGLIDPNADFTIRDHDYYDQYFNDDNSDYGKSEESYPPHHYAGALYCFLRVLTESEYYTNEDRVISLMPGESKQLTDAIVTQVRSYSLTAKLEGGGSDGEYNPGKLSGMVVKLWRAERPDQVPQNEGGDVAYESLFDAVKIAEGITNENGEVTFDHLVKNFGSNDTYMLSAYSSNDPSVNTALHNYSVWFEDFSWNNTPYGSSKEVDPSDADKPDMAYWNDEYVYAMVKETFTAIPNNPSMSGKVGREDNVTTPVPDAKLTIFKSVPSPMAVAATTYTNASGNYTFYNYPKMYEGNTELPGNLILFSTREGYNIYMASDYMPNLKQGQKHIYDLNMTAGAEVKGRVIDENGDPVIAQVNIGDGPNIMTDNAGYFQGMALSYQDQTIFVDPVDADYYSTTASFYINTYGVKNVGDLVVNKKQHHLEIHLSESGSGDAVVNAKISVNGTIYSANTDADGVARLAFENAATSFKIDVSGPLGEEWFNRSYTLVNYESGTYTVYYLTLEQATQVKGHVYVNGAPLKDAKVFVDMSGYNTQAFTDNAGAYVLHNVPKRSALTIKAVKSASDKVGDSSIVNTITNTADIDFQLTLFTEIDITKLWGFPIEVEHLTESGGKIYITGSFVQVPGNAHFALANNTETLHFDHLAIKPGSIKNVNNIGYAVPDGVSTIYFTDGNSVELKMYDKYLVDLGNSSYALRMESGGTDIGVLKGKAIVKSINFNESTLKFENAEGVYLNAPGVSDATQKMIIKTLVGNGTTPYTTTTGYAVSDASGGTITYDLFDCSGTAALTSSVVNADALQLNTTIHTAINSLSQPDIQKEVGVVKIKPNVSDAVATINGTNAFTLKMNKWNLTSSQWEFGKNGLRMLSGNLDADGLTIPFGQPIQINKSTLNYATSGTFNLTQMKLIGIIPLTVLGNSQFGYNGTNWQLSVVADGAEPAASIQGLPGMSNGTKFNFDLIYLQSNGTKQYQSRSTSTNYYGYADFVSNAGVLGVNATSITFNGGLDLHIPLLSEQQVSITYKNAGGVISDPELSQFNFKIQTNGVVADFSKLDKTFKASGFTCKGTISESGVFNHEAGLIKNSTSCRIDAVPGQTFTINPTKGSRLINVSGVMQSTDYDAWLPYTFTGDITGMTGASGTLTAEVFGDIAINEGQISLTNISTPFGSLSLIYDIDLKELTGTLFYPGPISAGLVSISDINAQVKVGSKGWYFASTCGVDPINLDVGFTGAMVFGDYPIKDESFIKDMFAAYSVLGTLPQGFQESITGFYFNYAAVPTESLPNIDFDFFVASGSLSVTVMADFGLGMNFAESAILHMSQGVKYNLHADAGVSVGLGCVHGGFDSEYLMYFAGVYNNASGTFTLSGDALFKVGASIEVGYGCCDSDCGACFDTPLGDSCNNEGISGEVIFTVHAEVDSNGDLDADFDVETVEL